MRLPLILLALFVLLVACAPGVFGEEAAVAEPAVAEPAVAEPAAVVLTLRDARPAADTPEPPEGYRPITEADGEKWFVADTPAMQLRQGDVTMVEALETGDTYALRLTMEPKTARAFNELTAKMVGRFIAVADGDELLMVPNVREPIRGAEVIIAGRFSPEKAEAYADRFGLEVQTVAARPPVPAWVTLPEHREAFNLAQRNQAEAAIAAYEKILEAPPEDPTTRFHLRQELAALYLDTRDIAEATKAFEAALAVEPPVRTDTVGPMMSCYHGLINIAQEQKDPERAAKLLVTAKERLDGIRAAAGEGPLSSGALLQSGYLELKYGDLDRAARIADEVVATDLKFQGYVLRGLLAEIEGNPEKAMTEYAMASRFDKERVDIAKEMINKAAQGGGNIRGLRRPIAAPGD